MKPPPQRLLAIALIIGGALVGIVIMFMMASYARSGHFSTAAATIGVIVAFMLFVLPQFGLGIYLIWHSLQNEKNEEKDES